MDLGLGDCRGRGARKSDVVTPSGLLPEARTVSWLEARLLTSSLWPVEAKPELTVRALCFDMSQFLAAVDAELSVWFKVCLRERLLASAAAAAAAAIS